MAMKKSESIKDYFGYFPKDIQRLLKIMRQTIQKAAPKAEEKISYGIPTYTLNGNLVHFGAFKSHIGFYPGSMAIATFKNELASFKGAKGSVQFPYDNPLPLPLITRIVKFRVKHNLSKKKKK